MDYLFVLKDKGTHNQGWWLKVTTPEQLADWYEKVSPIIYGNAFENYIYGKEFNSESKAHSPHRNECSLTYAIMIWAEHQNKSMSILSAIGGFRTEVALRQLHEIDEHGAIYINPVGGYHSAYDGEPKYDFVRKTELVFPDFKSSEIRVKQFPGGEHYYAYIGNMQVRDGDVIKWNTYDEAYKQALTIVEA